jgi:hypothetical protein
MGQADEEAEKTRKRAERRRKKKTKTRAKRGRDEPSGAAAAAASGGGDHNDDNVSVTSQEAREMLGEEDGGDLAPLHKAAGLGPAGSAAGAAARSAPQPPTSVRTLEGGSKRPRGAGVADV